VWTEGKQKQMDTLLMMIAAGIGVFAVLIVSNKILKRGHTPIASDRAASWRRPRWR
jgi:hypothetical protein